MKEIIILKLVSGEEVIAIETRGPSDSILRIRRPMVWVVRSLGTPEEHLELRHWMPAAVATSYFEIDRRHVMLFLPESRIDNYLLGTYRKQIGEQLDV